MKLLPLLAACTAVVATACASAPSVPPAAAPPATAQTAPSSEAMPAFERATFTFASRSGEPLLLDRIIDRTTAAPDKRPVIIFLFGGGWEGGSRTDAGLQSTYEHFASQGYAVVAIDYRLGIKIAKDRNEFTADNGTQMYLRAIEWSLEDLFDATSFVVQHADEWGIDKDQIVLLGGSAGATNALVAEFNVANETDLARSRLPEGFRYAGIISMAGAFWLEADTPLTFKNKPAPIMFFHGAKDQLVTYDEIQGPFSGYGPVAYSRLYAGPDYPKWFVDYPQGDHVIAGTPLSDQKLEMEAFLQKLVRERQAVSIHTVEESKSPKTFEAFLKALAESSASEPQ